MEQVVETADERRKRLNKERQARYRAKNAEKLRERHRQYNKSETKKASKARWLAENPGKPAEYTKAYKERNVEKTRAYEKKRGWLRRYGLTPEKYEEMLLEQQGCCKICKRHGDEFKKGLCIDHAHDSGKVRGLLCTNCNTALGLLKENKDLFQKAVEYLSESR